MSLRFKIGGEEHEYACALIEGANSDGWLPSKVEVRAGAFSGEYPCYLDTWAFARFSREVRDLYETLKGTATFTTYEGQLEIVLVGDGLGHVDVKVQAMDYAGTGNKLSIRLGIDQTSLPSLIKELDSIVAAYPPPNKSFERTREG